jgi:DNA invertase Pin-like site-specific DNA recombinase
MSSVKRAAILVRISDDKAEDALGVARQEKDCRVLAKQLGWPVAQVYVENDTSAYKRRTVRLPDGSTALRTFRPEFRRLLSDLAAGGCDALIGYDLDRVARDPRDLEDLIDVVERRHLPNRAVTGSLDLSTDSGVTMARVMVAVANKSSRDTSRRVTRKQQELAEQGKNKGGGIRSFGYERDGITVCEPEAEVLRRVAAEVLAGDSLVIIAKRLTADGVPTVLGNRFDDGRPRPWNPRSVHAAICKPRVAGLREYRGEVVGEAEWPAVLDRETWEQVRTTLSRRGEGHTNAFRYWLTGVLLCGRCGVALAGAQQGKGRPHRYWCNPQKGGCGGIGIDGKASELHVERLILAYLAAPKNLHALQAERSSSNLSQLRADVRQDEEQLRELAGMWAARSITTPEYMQARKAIEDRLAGARHLIRGALPGGVQALLTAGDLPEAWEALAPADRRETARVVFPQGVSGAPATVNRYQGFDDTRLLPVDPRRVASA